MKQRSLWGSILMVLGFVVCPCHLPITAPLLLTWLGGTAVAGFLPLNLAVLSGLSTLFLLALLLLAGGYFHNKKVVS